MSDPFDWQACYPAGVLRRWEPPSRPLWRFLADAAERDPDGVAVTFEARRRTFGEMRRDALAAGARFLREGARPGTPGAGPAAPGDRVLLVLPNCPEFIASYHGALAAGLVATTASPHLTSAELASIVRLAEPRVVVVDPDRRDELDAAIRASGVEDVRVVAVTPGAGIEPGPACSPIEQSPGDAAVLQTTSGTTGGLKAAVMTHGNLVANALQNDLWFGWTPEDVVLGALPLCHTWGMGCVMNAALAARARIVLVRRFDPDEALAEIARERVRIAYGSATMFHRLLDAAGAAAPERLASLRYVKAGAMLVGGDLSARWGAAVPSVPMVNGYGLTEAGPEVTNNPPQARRAGTVGVPLPGTWLRLGDAGSSANARAESGAGEVQIRGPQVMAGYWRDPGATAAAFTADGWLRTGDLARFDDGGYVVILDRLKDLIKHRGWSVVPGEVERALREHPSIAEACVVGVPDARDGEVPVAYVVLRDGAAAPDAVALAVHLEPRLARFKHPHRFVVVGEIPKNHVGKPLRRVLRDRAS